MQPRRSPGLAREAASQATRCQPPPGPGLAPSTARRTIGGRDGTDVAHRGRSRHRASPLAGLAAERPPGDPGRARTAWLTNWPCHVEILVRASTGWKATIMSAATRAMAEAANFMAGYKFCTPAPTSLHTPNTRIYNTQAAAPTSSWGSLGSLVGCTTPGEQRCSTAGGGGGAQRRSGTQGVRPAGGGAGGREARLAEAAPRVSGPGRDGRRARQARRRPAAWKARWVC